MRAVQNSVGFLFEPGARIRYVMDPAEKGTVVGVRHADVWDAGVDYEAFIEWDDGLDHGWYPIDELEPVEAP